MNHLLILSTLTKSFAGFAGFKFLLKMNLFSQTV